MSNIHKVHVRAVRIAEVVDMEIEIDFSKFINGMDGQAEAASLVREMILRGDVQMHPPKKALYVIPFGRSGCPEGFLE